MQGIGRNAPCPCGSGKKYKQCCLQRDEALAASKGSKASSIHEAIHAAVGHHQAGRLPQAEAIYRQILQVAPDHPDALHLSGLIASQVGKHETAVELISKAINVNPSMPSYYSNLGNALKEQGKLDAAVESYQKALSLDPGIAEAHYNLGIALQAQGKLDAAVESYQKTILLKPDYAEAHNNLGLALQTQGKLDAAAESYRKALVLKPDYAEAYSNMGFVLQAQGELDAAVESYHQALLLKPNYAVAHYNLGTACQAQGKFDAAAEYYRRALLLKPDYAEAYNNLGLVLQARGKLDAAVESYRKALSFRPDFVGAHSNLGAALQAQDKLEAAAEHLHHALALKPDVAETHNNLGLALQAQGKLDSAIGHYHEALALKPDFAEAYNNLLFLHAYHALLAPPAYLTLARGWEQACLPAQERQAAQRRSFLNKPLAGRRLKVGYVSGDLRRHAVSYFVEQLFAHHDRTKIELFAYSNHGIRDTVTERLQASAEHWIPLVGVSDAAARERIEADGIDILIDLSGHSAHNRLGIFARRAAPVQAHYLGFFASTGLTEMDYWIGDEILTPAETDDHYNEQTWRLPRVWVSYEGKAGAPLPGWRPAADGTVWLGSFNNLGKLTPATLALWAKVLHALPEGKLLLKTKELADSGNRRRILDSLAVHGIAPERIELQDSGITPGWPEHMAYYDRLDIALDPVGGVGGGTTTCDALWMAAPMVTLMGDRMASRMTASMLNAIGHPEWIARAEAEYVDKVVALARDMAQRKALRLIQRKQMAESPLCDAHSLAMSLENAYLEMFERWLKKQNGQLPVTEHKEPD